ncbi:MAG: SRPBCC family protein [Bacteroidetes bacterium]|nr:SRPBCC family protein [Bacteroidota bacterium]
MKFQAEITINLPIHKVIELFDNAENLKQWQPDLISFEHLSGEPGQAGAKSRLIYKMGKRKITMVETITRKNLPFEFSGTYEAKGVFNEVKNFFTPIGPDKTKYSTDNLFKFKGFMKVVALLMPGAFKKQSQKFLEQFKAFAEEAGRE